MSRASFPPKVPTIRRPFLHRVPSGRFPASSVILSAPTPRHPSPQASLPSPSDTASAPASSLPSPEGCFPGRASGRDHRLSHSGFHSADMTGPPRFLEDPMSACPALRPGGTLTLLLIHARMLPSAGNTASASATHLSRLNHTAYRPPVYASQPGLPQDHATLVPAASTLCRVGLPTYRVPLRSFYILMEVSPPSRLCLAHITK